MIAKLELDCGVIHTFHVVTERQAIDRAVKVCRDDSQGGLLIINGVDYGEFDYGEFDYGEFDYGLVFYFTNLSTGETWNIVE